MTKRTGDIIDLIICTYNRDEVLADCLESLSKQSAPSDIWNIILINNSKEDLGQRSKKILEKIINVKVIIEEKVGLSFARNKGIAESKARWLAFLDDDTRIPADYLKKALAIIKEDKFDCFGGHIQSWWKFGRPRWLEKSYGSKPVLLHNRGTLNEDYNWGSNIFIKRAALKEIGGFPTNIGLKGNKLGYAAENMVQINLRNSNYKIGYDPDLFIEHLVMPHKLKLWWHLKAAYTSGRDGRKVFSEQYKLKGFLISLKSCLTGSPRAFFNFVTHKDFYWQNLILEIGKPIALLIGKVASLFK